MNPVEIVGYLAAVLTTASFVPQALQILRTRETKGISLSMYVAFSAGVALWVVYGLVYRSWPLVLANVVTLALALSILFMKLRYQSCPAVSETSAPASQA